MSLTFNAVHCFSTKDSNESFLALFEDLAIAEDAGNVADDEDPGEEDEDGDDDSEDEKVGQTLTCPEEPSFLKPRDTTYSTCLGQ
jgi:hypothetical protein